MNTCAPLVLMMWSLLTGTPAIAAELAGVPVSPPAVQATEFPPIQFSDAIEVCAQTFEPSGAPIPRERMIDDGNATFKEQNRVNITWLEDNGSRVVCSVGLFTQQVEDFKRGYGLYMHALGKQAITLLEASFHELSEEDRKKLQETFHVGLRAADTYGVVQDVQTVNRSTPGSKVGSAVGSGIAGIAYLDRSLSGNKNYSPWVHLGLMLLGGLVGSAADTAPVEQYESQYTIKMMDGSTKQIVTGHSSAFVVPAGSCMDLTYEHLADGMCWQSVEDIRIAYLGKTPEPEKPTIRGVAPPAHTFSVADELIKFRELQKQGVLTQAEFEAQKTKLLHP